MPHAKVYPALTCTNATKPGRSVGTPSPQHAENPDPNRTPQAYLFVPYSAASICVNWTPASGASEIPEPQQAAAVSSNTGAARTLTLVDLAGSEWSRDQAGHDDVRRAEARPA